MKKLAILALAVVMVVSLSVAAVVVLADNTVTSSTMIFEGTLTPEGGGKYSGVLPMVDEAVGPTGDGVSGYDVYAKNGGTAQFGDDPGTGAVWTPVSIGTTPNDHDAWSTWSPDTPDWYQYSLKLYKDGDDYKWAVRNHAGATAVAPWSSNPATYPARGVPMSGSMNWSNMYAEETDTGAYLSGMGTAEIPGGAAAHGGGAQCWDMDWSWGSEAVPLEYPGFDVAIEDLGSTYRVTMTPAKASSSVGVSANLDVIVCISVSPTSIDYKTISAGHTQSDMLTVSNCGTVIVEVTHEVVGDALFTDNLDVSPVSRDIGVSLSDTFTATLTVPGDYVPQGLETGTIIFWAEQTP